MRIQQLSESKNYLYEGLDYNSRSVMSLWESAGIKLKEAALTPDQINSLFAEVEKASTAAGSNRTMLGKGKDAADAVNKAWEDLKTKIQDSGPIKAVDQKYDDVVAKIEKGLGGPDNAVNQVIQKYRKFAKEHPVAQGIIYSALIAAAGISGAGLGGAAVLGLLKMTDKLLQGEKFSSAAYAGAKTGLMAFAASKLGDYLKDKWKTYSAENHYYVNGQEVDKATYEASIKEMNKMMKDADMDMNNFKPGEADKIAKQVFSDDSNLDSMAKAQELRKQLGGQGFNPTDPDGALKLGIRGNTSVADADAALPGLKAKLADIDVSKAADVAASAPKGAAMDPGYLEKVLSGDHPRPMISPEQAQAALDWQAQNGGQAASAAKDVAKAASGYSKEYLEKVLSGDHPRPMISKEKAAALLKSMESTVHVGHQLSEGQVYLVFKQVCTTNDTFIAEGKLLEGPFDAIKGLAGKAVDKAKTIGTNLTTKVTADKLNSAWQKAGSPTDSEELKKFLTGQGVDAGVVDTVYKTLKIKATGATSLYAQVKTDLAKVDKKGKQRLMAYLQKQLGTA